ncbi:MAG: D-alanyl-D-alanine carboxypeptidase [Clostridia bacterium]|nr:D-alanyl-D-alanine carboxypeptidase [Clostridia bacterium]
MEQQNKTPVAKKRNSEALLAIFFILLCFFIAILSVVLLARSCSMSPDKGDTSDSESETTTETPPPVDVPVFAGGTVPTPPYASSSTAAISASLASQYVALVNAETGEIVASLNSNARFSPASMTKVMTLIVACEMLNEDDLDAKLTMTQEIYDYVRSGDYFGSTIFGIDVGDEYVLRDLLYGIGMESASDCVMPVVLYLCDSEADFAVLMNQKATELGLKNTKFDNAIGYDSENNYTTAEDMAVIMAYAMQSDLIRDILGKETYRSYAAGYNSSGEYVPSFGFTFYSTLFGSHDSSRMSAYKSHYGTAFSLKTSRLLAGKTGYLTDNHCLVTYISANSGGTKYVLILGGSAQKQYRTMADLKEILDTYIP